jgi:hypothetical protein
MKDKEIQMFAAASVDSETASLSENGEGGTDKDTSTDLLKNSARKGANESQADHDTGIVELTYPPENRTLREIFDRSKSVALDCSQELSEMIPDLKLDGRFGRTTLRTTSGQCRRLS